MKNLFDTAVYFYYYFFFMGSKERVGFAVQKSFG